MMAVFIGDFGSKEGVQTFRICGTKKEIVDLLEEIVADGYKFFDTPNLLHVHRGQWTLLLQLKIPVGVGER